MSLSTFPQPLVLHCSLLLWDGSRFPPFSSQIIYPNFPLQVQFKKTLSRNMLISNIMDFPILFLASSGGLCPEVCFRFPVVGCLRIYFYFFCFLKFIILVFEAQFEMGLCCFFEMLQIKLMEGQEQRQKRRFTLGYMPWLSLKRIWFLNMSNPLKGVRVPEYIVSF